MRDVLIEVLGDKLEYKENHITENYTFRELIQKNVKANSWGSLGMDVAIGAVVDRKAKPIEYQFLPEYVLEGANNAGVIRNNEEVSLVKKYNYLFEAEKQEPKTNFFLSPFFVFGCLGIWLIFITYRDSKNKTRSRITDLLIFLITGIVGVLLLLLWIATDHTSTVNNYNLLWAFPISILFVLHIFKKFPKTWLRKYVFFLIILLALLAIHWTTGVQVFAIGLLPLLIALGIRYIYLWYFLGKKQS
jgi:membrane-associated HD superfamily phosphohydrolase